MLKTFSISSVLLIFCYLHSAAQSKGDYVWIFGSNAEPLEGSEGSLLVFNDTAGRDTAYMPLSANIGSNNASLCDEDGRLLFYTNGCAVFDSTFQIMDNGDGINEGSLVVQCDIGNYSGVQNSIIIPDNYNDAQYYYLHKTTDLTDDFNVLISAMNYTTISFESKSLGEVLVIEWIYGSDSTSKWKRLVGHRLYKRASRTLLLGLSDR